MDEAAPERGWVNRRREYGFTILVAAASTYLFTRWGTAGFAVAGGR